MVHTNGTHANGASNGQTREYKPFNNLFFTPARFRASLAPTHVAHTSSQVIGFKPNTDEIDYEEYRRFINRFSELLTSRLPSRAHDAFSAT